MIIGGDSLEENFVINDEGSSSAEDSDSESANIENGQILTKPDTSDLSSHELDSKSLPQAKKTKLNMREAATSGDGGVGSQKAMLSIALKAFEKYFPNQMCPLSLDELDRLTLVDCSRFTNQSCKAVSDMLKFLNEETGSLEVPASPHLRTLIITGSGTRAMYIVKELREVNKDLSPLPLFFHGGGRKKEQSKTHESVLAKSKSVVAVSLPSRLLDNAKRDLLDVSRLELVIIDLKVNEKGLNVFSQKDTMQDVLTFIGHYILPHAGGIKLAML